MADYLREVIMVAERSHLNGTAQAPTFVLTTGRQGEACLNNLRKECSQSLRATGDVTLDYVLERWAQGGSPLAAEARSRLAMLEYRP